MSVLISSIAHNKQLNGSFRFAKFYSLGCSLLSLKSGRDLLGFLSAKIF